MRRFTLLIVISLALGACGGDTAVTTTSSTSTSSTTMSSTTTTAATEAPPETTTTTIDFSQFTSTTAYQPVEPEYVLLLDGFEFFGVLGGEADSVIEAFQAEFGDPTADSDWLGVAEHGCSFQGPMRTVVWIEPGVRLTFVDGDSELGEGEHLVLYSTVLPIDPPWELDGIRREMTIEQVQEVFPDAEVLPDTPLRNIRFDPDIDSYASIDAADQIREFWAGNDYCAD